MMPLDPVARVRPGWLGEREYEAPTGRAGRAGRLAVASAFTLALPALALVGPMLLHAPLPVTVLLLGSMVLTVWLWVRLPFTGVIPTERSVVVRSWFSRREYDRASILRFRHVEYSGLFFYLAWPSDTGWLASGMVEVELRNGTRIPLRATVCGIADARRIAEALNRWVGAGVGDGRGPRRRRDYGARGESPSTRSQSWPWAGTMTSTGGARTRQMDGDTVAEKHSIGSWVIAFFREGVQTGLFFWYIVGSLLAVFVVPGDRASALIAVFVVGLLMAIVVVSRLRRRLRTKNEDAGDR